MGSNANRHGDKHFVREWGSKARKHEHSAKRHAHDRAVIEDELDPKPTPGGARKRKDTRRWCRGKEGREHDVQYVKPEVEPDIRYRWWNRGRYECVNCGMKRWRIDGRW